MENDQNKPITLVRQEFIEKLLDLINNTPLPCFVIEDTINLFITDIHNASIKQLQDDTERYNNKVSGKTNSKK